MTLATDETLTSTAGNITFDSTIDGAHDLSVNAASGTITFERLVGGGTPLSSLTAEGANVVVEAASRPPATSSSRKRHHLRGRHIETMTHGHGLASGGYARLQCARRPSTPARFEYAPFTPAPPSRWAPAASCRTPISPSMRDAARRRRDGSGHLHARHDGRFDHHRGGRLRLAEHRSRSRDDGRRQRRLALRRNTLSGNAASVDLTRLQRHPDIGDFTATNDFTLNNAFQLDVTGPLTSTNGNIMLTDGRRWNLRSAAMCRRRVRDTQILALQTGDVTQTGGAIIADELTGLALSASLTHGQQGRNARSIRYRQQL